MTENVGGMQGMESLSQQPALLDLLPFNRLNASLLQRNSRALPWWSWWRRKVPRSAWPCQEELTKTASRECPTYGKEGLLPGNCFMGKQTKGNKGIINLKNRVYQKRSLIDKWQLSLPGSASPQKHSEHPSETAPRLCQKLVQAVLKPVGTFMSTQDQPSSHRFSFDRTA